MLWAVFSASLLLTSCASDEVIETQIEKGLTPISVDVYTQGLTRSFDAADATSLKTTGFSLRISTASETIFDGDVSYVGDKYQLGDGTKEYYWPISEDTDVTFTAISKKGQQGVTAFAPTNEDILVATTTVKQSAASNGTISLSFTHLLSAATLNIVLNNTTPSIALTANVSTLTLVRDKSTYDFTTNQWNNANTTQAFDDAAPTTLTTTATTLIDEKLLVPGKYTLTVNYTVINGRDESKPLEKKGSFELTAGTRQIINVSLPVQATAMGVDVTSTTVKDWTTAGTTTDVTLNPAP